MDLATVDQLLTTTRSVRKRLDLTRPVEMEIIERCIDIAIQAPSASNAQRWHFVVIADPKQRSAVGDLYHRSFSIYLKEQQAADPQRRAQLTAARWEQTMRVRESAVYLSEHMGEAPVLIIPCIEGRVENAGQQAQAATYGSILPATWSLMLALRARGLGSAWTTLHLRYEREVAAVLGIPDTVTQAALLPVAYYTGEEFKPATRVSAKEFTHWNIW
ncbi:MAG: nitroreductase family protein [Chloroflexi bacterium]|nr:nitroreductase family protein [Chloroflexota bacterium]